jgi:hypothetical protein
VECLTFWQKMIKLLVNDGSFILLMSSREDGYVVS